MASGKFKPTELGGDADRAIRAEGLAELLGAVVHIPVIVPRTKIRGRMRVVKRSEALAAKAATRRTLELAGLPTDPASVMGVFREEWNAELAVQHLAAAIRDPDETIDRPLGTAEEWRDCDDDQIAALWSQYEDHRMQIDPLATLDELELVDIEAMRDAAKKKDCDRLMSYGSRKLASYAISTAEQPAI